MDQASPNVRSTGAPLARGQSVGGRFNVEDLVSEDSIGWFYRASDQKTSRPVALRLIRPTSASKELAEALRDDVRAAAELTDRGVIATYGLGAAHGGTFFVACEWADGESLAQVIARRRSQGLAGVSLGGAQTVIRAVCLALSSAHARTSHGALRPSIVWITSRGRLKVGEFGVARAVLRTLGPGAFGPTEQAYLAPEVRLGQAPTSASDVFGIGALLYVLLTGRSPAEDFVAPSQVHPEASPQLDALLMKALAGDPSARFENPQQLREAFIALTGELPPSQGDEFGVPLSPRDATTKTANNSPRATPAPQAPRTSNAAPAVGQRISIHEQFRPSVPNEPSGARPMPRAPAPPAAKPGPAVRPAPGLPPDPRLVPPDAQPSGPTPPQAGAAQASAVSGGDLNAAMARITENDAARWMVVKNRLDHGPFSGRELVQGILKGEILGEHGLLNMDTGERTSVEKSSDFAEFVEQYKLRKRAADEQAALVRSTKVETASNLVKALVALAVVAVIGGGVGIYYATRGAGGEQHRASAELADLYERGEMRITGTAGILPPPPARRAGGGGGGGGPRPARTGGAMSYEDAMNQVVNMGDVGSGGGEQTLRPADIQGVMNARINSFFGCVGQELHRGGSLNTVRIDIAIAGSGQVLGSSVNAGSAEFQQCMAAKVRQVHFPSFSAPRMGARFSFSVD